MAEMEFPTRVKVSYKTYRIEDWHPKAAAGAGRYGEASHQERVLRIDTSFGPIQTADTLMHEILHAIASVGHTELFSGSEERAVEGVAAGVTQVMRDNPAVRDWFAWAWAQED